MEALEKITVLFTIIMASALLVERMLEVIKTIINLLDSRYDWYNYWTEKAKSLRDKIERKLNVFEYVQTQQMAKYLRKFQGLFLQNIDDKITHVPVIYGDFVREFYIKIYAKILAVALGIILAFWFKMDLLTIWAKYTDNGINFPEGALRFILTGVIIGLGSGPVHKIITTIEKKREKQNSKKT